MVMTVVVLFVLARNLASSLGANLGVVFSALWHIVAGLVVLDGLVIASWTMGMFSSLRETGWLLVAVTLSVVWWFLCPVFDSMALNGQDPAAEMVFGTGDTPIWDSGLLQWTLSGVLLAFVAFRLWRAVRED